METGAVVNINQFKVIEKDLKRFLMSYRFALEEVKTKIGILNDEFHYIHDYNPIEHVKSRIKSPESILEKLNRKNVEPSLSSIRQNIKDIAGMRIVCSFVSDIYTLAEMLDQQKELEIVDYKDYIQHPKPNGYQSLHLIVQVPVHMTDRVEKVLVEIQIRTIGMEFWASLEHKIDYKYNREVPRRLKNELRDVAKVVADLDRRMEKLNQEIVEIKKTDGGDEN